jgi:hypothetical protein
MKKKIIIGLLMVSALSFGAMNNNSNSIRGKYHNQMISQLSEKQKQELMKEMQARREENYKEGLNIKTKQIELEKLLVEDKVNWKSVEKLNKEISEMQAKQRLERMKYKKSVEDKYGITMGHRGMESNHTKGNGMGYQSGSRYGQN